MNEVLSNRKLLCLIGLLDEYSASSKTYFSNVDVNGSFNTILIHGLK